MEPSKQCLNATGGSSANDSQADQPQMAADAESHPLVKFAGMFEDNPLFDEWKAEMAEYRRKLDEDPDTSF